MINSSVLKKVLESIRSAKEVAISGHINPDGDSIGSLLSLGLGLKRLGKRVHMISYDEVPRRYRFLPGANKIVRRLKRKVDLAIAVDCSTKEMLGKTYDIFRRASSIVEIDHHNFRRPFGDIVLLDENAAAVGEIIYVILKGLRVRISKEMGQNLMTSIIVETNSFRLPNVRPFTFEVCTKLMDAGINFYKLIDMIFWSKTRQSAVLTGICLARCKFARQGRLAWSVVRRNDFDITKGGDEDVDIVPDEMRSIKNVRVAILFREKDEKTLRVSLRSKGRINVAAIAERYNGGGHFDVAGCIIPNNPRSIRELLKKTETLLP